MRPRAAVTALARARAAIPSHPGATEQVDPDGLSRSPARYRWALRISRIYETFPFPCPQGGTEMRIVAFVTDTASVLRLLEHIGESTKAPVLLPARGPPAWELYDQTTVFEPVAPAPEAAFEFDQSVTW